MKTIIEIYDDEPIYNVLAPTIMRPEQVVYIGGNRITGKRIKNKIIRYFEERKLDTYAFFYPTNIYDCGKVMETLEMLIERFPDCAIDVSGGNSVLVFAIGMFCAIHEIPAFAYNIKDNTFCNIFACDEIDSLPSEIALNARECLAMAGASLMRHGHIDGDTLTPEDLSDISNVWEIFRKYQNSWPRHTQYLQAVSGTPEPDSEPVLDIDALLSRKTSFNKTINANMNIMQELASCGVIENLVIEEDRIRFSFKNQIMRQCLLDVGIWLELFVYTTCRESDFFDDVQISVVVDWNGDEEETINTINEIDLVMTHGITPVFVSCKTGVPTTTTLNELHTLTEQFGGRYAKCVLATMCKLSEVSPSTYKRALDMGIHVIQCEDISAPTLLKKLSNIVLAQ